MTRFGDVALPAAALEQTQPDSLRLEFALVALALSSTEGRLGRPTRVLASFVLVATGCVTSSQVVSEFFKVPLCCLDSQLSTKLRAFFKN